MNNTSISEEALSAIQEDLAKSGVKTRIKDGKIVVGSGTEEIPDMNISEEEAELLKQYNDVYIKLGYSHRRTRRFLDKATGYKQPFKLGSYTHGKTKAPKAIKKSKKKKDEPVPSA